MLSGFQILDKEVFMHVNQSRQIKVVYTLMLLKLVS